MPPAPLDQKCDALRRLHVRGNPLVLPNAWDVPSARAVAAAGFSAVATTSAGVADALGYEDAERAPWTEMFAAAARIARCVEVPVTCDAESGYGLEPYELVDALRDAGVAGCNLEDTDHQAGGLVEIDRQAKRLAAIRRAASGRGYGLVINARVDVFLTRHAGRPEQDRMEDGIARARAYLAAGADCVYPIVLADEHAIAHFVDAVDAPVNILRQPQAPPTARLAELGVARVSYGSGIMRRLFDDLAKILAEVHA